MTKVMALKEGLLLAQQMGCNGFIIHSDSMEVVDTMKSDITSTAGVGFHSRYYILPLQNAKLFSRLPS